MQIYEKPPNLTSNKQILSQTFQNADQFPTELVKIIEIIAKI